MEYKGFFIDLTTYPFISVQVNGDDWAFHSVKEAKAAIDEYIKEEQE